MKSPSRSHASWRDPPARYMAVSREELTLSERSGNSGPRVGGLRQVHRYQRLALLVHGRREVRSGLQIHTRRRREVQLRSCHLGPGHHRDSRGFVPAIQSQRYDETCRRHAVIPSQSSPGDQRDRAVGRSALEGFQDSPIRWHTCRHRGKPWRRRDHFGGRFARILAPPRVDMRVRKPCVRRRRLLWG